MPYGLLTDRPLVGSVTAPDLPRRPDHAGKRFLDLVLAVLLVLASAPLLLLIGLVVGTTSRGGVLYRQTRLGRDGQAFTMLKFRTMCADGHERREDLRAFDEGSGPLFKIRRDPRVTAVGRVLRRYSLDELPQLFNVIVGHMSLVGPRPALPEEAAVYTAHEWRRLHARPGITGLWQVSGRSDLSWEHSIHLDLHYVRHASLLLDLRVLLRTVSAVLTGRGAY